ncbi:MAG: hypothetical protein MUQ56_14220 [Thermoleophilia bacterium]|nr:hypothetical protein [Thermoleophilia bacterium]
MSPSVFHETASYGHVFHLRVSGDKSVAHIPDHRLDRSRTVHRRVEGLDVGVERDRDGALNQVSAQWCLATAASGKQQRKRSGRDSGDCAKPKAGEEKLPACQGVFSLVGSACSHHPPST